jgi:GNAT superfamily N-acetyltransferase
MSMNIVRVCGAEIESVWKDLAELRIQVFREFPYLYEGTFDYEREYLATYWKSPRSLAVLVKDAGRCVGATTSLPLLDEQAEFRAPFADPEQYFYLGESVLLPQYRGQGLGATFFDERERYARRLGFSKACFCAVERTEEPPVGYRPLHEFWTKRGYQRRDDLRTEFSWTDVGANAETAKPMVFWVRDPL